MHEILLSELNAHLLDDPEMVVIDAEAKYDRKIRYIADIICRHAADRPITLIAGPSGSGKTSTACRIEQILDAAGFESHTLSMDNYYADGPFGAKGAGELTLLGGAPAYTAAVEQATGKAYPNIPLTPERILAAEAK